MENTKNTFITFLDFLNVKPAKSFFNIYVNEHTYKNNSHEAKSAYIKHLRYIL